jgi:hypothetical protein
MTDRTPVLIERLTKCEGMITKSGAVNVSATLGLLIEARDALAERAAFLDFTYAEADLYTGQDGARKSRANLQSAEGVVSEDILDVGRRYLEASREPVAHMDAAFTIIVGLCGEVERLREAPVIPEAVREAVEKGVQSWGWVDDNWNVVDPVATARVRLKRDIARAWLASPKAVPTKDLREKIEALPRYAFDFSEATVVRDGWLISREAVLALIAGNVPEAPQ